MKSTSRSAAALLLALCLAAGALDAGALEDPEVLLERVGNRYRGVATVSAEFVQREKVATLGRTRESRGTVSLRRPGMMRWEYAAPERRLVVSDGRTLWFWYPGENTAYRLPLGPDELEETPLALLFGTQSRLGEVFRATGAMQQEDGNVRLDLAPLRETRELSRLSLIVERDGTLKGTVIRDAFGNVNEITLSRVSEGVALDEGRFSFKPPADARILDAKGQGR